MAGSGFDRGYAADSFYRPFDRDVIYTNELTVGLQQALGDQLLNFLAQGDFGP